MKHFLLIISTLILSLPSLSQINIEGEWETESVPKFRYTFDSTKYMKFNWINDLGSYERTGNYEIINNKVEITFNSVFELKRDSLIINEETLTITSKHKPKYLGVYFNIYRDDSIQLIIMDSSNTFQIENIEVVDSIYFGTENTCTNPLYQIPKDQIIGGLLYFEVNYYLMTKPFHSDKETLQIINKKAIFKGSDYEPDIIYINGILKKTKAQQRLK